MFKTPRSGWSEFDLEGFRDGFGWLHDSPGKCIRAFISLFSPSEGKRTKDGRDGEIVFFDAEGWEYELVLTRFYPCCVLRFKDGNPPELIVLKESCLQLAEALAKEIEDHFDVWLDEWFVSFQVEQDIDGKPAPACREVRKNELSADLTRLKQAIAEWRSIMQDIEERMAKAEADSRERTRLASDHGEA